MSFTWNETRNGVHRRTDRSGAGRLCGRFRGLDELPIVGIGIDLPQDPVHHLNGFDRILARGRFRRQHHGIRAVIDRRRDVGGLRTRGHGRTDHRFQHLRGDDHRLPQPPAGAHDAALDRRHLFRRQLHAQVAARDHDGIRFFDDLVEMLDRRGLLELGP